MNNQADQEIIAELIAENEQQIESYREKIQILDQFIDETGLRKEFDNYCEKKNHVIKHRR